MKGRQFNHTNFINSARKNNYYLPKHHEIEKMLHAKPVVLQGDVAHNSTAAAILSFATMLSVVNNSVLSGEDNTARLKRSIDSDRSMLNPVETKNGDPLTRLVRSEEPQTIQQFNLPNGNCLKIEISFNPNQPEFRTAYQCFNKPCNPEQKVGFLEAKHLGWRHDPDELTITPTDRDDTVAIIRNNNPAHTKLIQCNLKVPIGDMPSSAHTINSAIIGLVGKVLLGLGAINFVGFDPCVDEKESKSHKVLLKSDTEEGNLGYILDASPELDVQKDYIDVNLVGDFNNNV